MAGRNHTPWEKGCFSKKKKKIDKTLCFGLVLADVPHQLEWGNRWVFGVKAVGNGPHKVLLGLGCALGNGCEVKRKKS